MSEVRTIEETMMFLNYPVTIQRQAYRRSLSVKIQPDQKLLVRTHLQQSDKIIFDFLRSKSRWIEKNMQRLKENEARFPKPRFENGSYFPWLGELKYFQFTESWQKKISFKIEDGFLIASVPQGLPPNPDQLQKSLTAFYKKMSVNYLTSRTQLWQERTGMAPARLVFRSGKTRWGSCSSQNHIALNWKLICQPESLIDYVIVHELCHLKFLNHSPQFWQLVESILPQYKDIEKILQQQAQLGNFLK